MVEFTQDNVKVMPQEVEAVVTQLEVLSASNVFGDGAKDPNQRVLVIAAENATHNIKVEDNCNYFEEVPDNSKLGKIILKYGGLKVGSKIVVRKDDKGFYRVAY